jgi:hypothetical protein
MLYWEKNSLEAFLSKSVGAHSCLQTMDRYRKLVGEAHKTRESKDELPERQWTGISTIRPPPLPRQ